MKFRCPYCKHEFGEEPLSRCPECGKAVAIPGPFRKSDRKKREPARIRHSHDTRNTPTPVFEPVRKPSTILGVIAILAIVGGILISRTTTTTESRRRRTPLEQAEKELTVLRTALEYFHQHCGDYPEEAGGPAGDGLMNLIHNPGNPGWRGRYVTRIRPDPWGIPYVYQKQKGAMRIYSGGPDKKAGTADDVFPAAIDFDNLPPWPSREEFDAAEQEVIPVFITPVSGKHGEESK